MDAPSIDPVAVVLTITREDLVNVEPLWTVNCTEPCQAVVGVGRRSRRDAGSTHKTVIGAHGLKKVSRLLCIEEEFKPWTPPGPTVLVTGAP